MHAMILAKTGALGAAPLVWTELPDPVPGPGEILVGVRACGVCHTEIDEIEGRTPPSALPRVPGHQVVGHVEALGPGTTGFTVGDRVGVAWIFSACGVCSFCRRGLENLCPAFRATGRDADGGYAERMRVPAAFAVPIPTAFCDLAAAPLLCAGAVGSRALRLTGLSDGGALGLVGFGASAHLVLKLARRRFPNARVHVFARDPDERAFALSLGAHWAGAPHDAAPEPLDAAIDTTPAWAPIVGALRNLAPGGRLVVNAIRKEDGDKSALLGLDWATHLWMEKEVKSVANVTRADVRAFLEEAAAIPLQPEVEVYPLAEANRALADLRGRHVRGGKVLRVG